MTDILTVARKELREIVGGGSGHAFKHGPVLGEHIAHRVTGKETSAELVETFKLKDTVF